MVLFFIFPPFLPHPAGTDSERSFSGRDSHRRLLRQSVAGGSGGGGSVCGVSYPHVKPMKIAAINGKPKVTRYLSKECKFYFLFIYFVDIVFCIVCKSFCVCFVWLHDIIILYI